MMIPPTVNLLHAKACTGYLVQSACQLLRHNKTWDTEKGVSITKAGSISIPKPCHPISPFTRAVSSLSKPNPRPPGQNAYTHNKRGTREKNTEYPKKPLRALDVSLAQTQRSTNHLYLCSFKAETPCPIATILWSVLPMPN